MRVAKRVEKSYGELPEGRKTAPFSLSDVSMPSTSDTSMKTRWMTVLSVSANRQLPSQWRTFERTLLNLWLLLVIFLGFVKSDQFLFHVKMSCKNVFAVVSVCIRRKHTSMRNIIPSPKPTRGFRSPQPMFCCPLRMLQLGVRMHKEPTLLSSSLRIAYTGFNIWRKSLPLVY